MCPTCLSKTAWAAGYVGRLLQGFRIGAAVFAGLCDYTTTPAGGGFTM